MKEIQKREDAGAKNVSKCHIYFLWFLLNKTKQHADVMHAKYRWNLTISAYGIRTDSAEFDFTPTSNEMRKKTDSLWPNLCETDFFIAGEFF